ncbi:MAG: alcohol dehydrogenase catalytic domain-containing protein [Phycisphaerae bacterium]|nr:alcohol dehydrogenase catalytic domain-containing protein [Phycisphaerae bacterium]MDD5381177.1 alcohol dehydrogenase catalytic domain-containing protein [Phycisphaerae bacterium]
MKTQNSAYLPPTQHAVQLIGKDKLVFNKRKEVFTPGRGQILCRVEAVGLCFSDLKLLKQFSSHVRKSKIISGIDSAVLREIPSYVPNEAPAVPGHETVVRIAAVGPGVKNFKCGQRYLVQTDYRWLRTAGSNAAFGYNFEGALQEYVLMDQRIITSPKGESMLLPVSEELSASAIALVEPWACVEDAYAAPERRKLKSDGRMLVVAGVGVAEDIFTGLFNHYGRPAQITWLSKFPAQAGLNVIKTNAKKISQLPDTAYDDVIYFGSEPEAVEALFAKVAPYGLFNIVLCGGSLRRDIVTMVGRVHYSNIRIIGTTGSDPAESMKHIPAAAEIRPDDKINCIGAGGPMGTMHVIRNICQQVKDVSVFAADTDEDRLAALSEIVAPLAEKNNVTYKPYNPAKVKVEDAFDYTVLMAPLPELLADSVKNAAKGGIINIFAGLPATVTAKINLDVYIEKQLYFVGTSGSVLEDMKRMLAKAESGRLDTNVSVGAVCGLDGAIDGIRAVENRSITGKIIVYPACKGLALTPLAKLKEKMPQVAECLNNGLWTKQAEEKLLESFTV